MTMRKIFRYSLLIAVFLVIHSAMAQAAESGFKPLSPEFLQWQAEQKSSSSVITRKSSSSSSSSFKNGYIPIPIDLSHLASNPPVETTSPVPNRKAVSAYDLRSVGGKSYVTSIKNQNPYGTCWAHAAIGAMESNYLMQGKSALDLSEMHLAWFAFKNSTASAAFDNMNSKSFKEVMDHGGNSFYPTALFSRLSGPANETEVPYPTQPSKSTPDSYTRVLRLRDVFYLGFGDNKNVNESSSTRDIIKNRIMANGSVVASYHHDDSYYYKSAKGTGYYYNTTATTNHAVQIVGWDDSYSRSNFKSGSQPSMDGAWLIKNSWGTSWGDGGYFWMSYAQKLTDGSAFVVEDADSSMKAYYYDALGWSGHWGYTSGASNIYFANVFRATRNETLTEVAFYTPDNNINYEINVYAGMSSMPSSSPIPSGGTSLSTQSGSIAFAGYHTITLNTPVSLSNGEYFSVVVRFKGYTTTAVEMKTNNGFTDNAVIDKGSFFSSNGQNWTTGESNAINACVKAFTVTGSVSGTAPRINTSSLSNGFLKQSYSSYVTATGTTPMTWALTAGSLPSGLSLDTSTGSISGTPTATGSYTFTITVTNSYGSASKSYTIDVYDMPVISTTELTGYVGYSFSQKLQLTPSTSATWTAKGSLPAGLSLNKSSGLISGKPTKAGTYNISFNAVTSQGTSTGTVKFTINAKPVKPVINVSSLKIGTVGYAYSQAISVTGTAPISLTVTGLPSGLSLTKSTVYMSGTPAAAGTFTVKITAENIATQLDKKPVTKTLKLTIKARPPVIASPGTLKDAVMGEAYSSVQFTASDGTTPITWSISGQPSGMKMSSSGILSGTPTKAGKFTMTVTAKNAAGKATLKVPLTVVQKPTLSTNSLTAATTDKKYTLKLSAKGSANIKWTVTGLPSTLKFSQVSTGATATITGTPTEAGKYTVKFTLTNSAGSTEKTLTLTVNGVAPKLTATLANARAGSSYSGSKISATGTKPITISYSISASDKAKFGISSLSDLGLTFTANPSDGTAKITGTPTISIKSLPITFTAKNSVSSSGVTRKVNFTVTGTKPTFTTPSAATTTLTKEVNSNIEIDFKVNGTKNITFTMSGAGGFKLTKTGDYTAKLTGKAPAKDSTTNITITAANADGKATRKIVIKTMTSPKITTSSLSSATLSKSYSSRLTATGTKTIKWKVTGKLPSGITFSSGTFKGTPKATGSYTVTVTASNTIGNTSKTFTLSVVDPKAKSVKSASAPALKTSSAAPTSTSTTGTANTAGTQPAIKSAVPATNNESSSTVTKQEYDSVVFVLPEISVDVSGMYDFDAELSNDVPVGAKLIWLANPEDGKSSSDDEIAEFYDGGTGEEISDVPEKRKITVSAWLNKGVIYSPAIAVKTK